MAATRKVTKADRAKQREAGKRYREKNHARIAARKKAAYRVDIEKSRKRARELYHANLDAVQASARKTYRKHRDKILRRARIAQKRFPEKHRAESLRDSRYASLGVALINAEVVPKHLLTQFGF